MLEQNKDLLKSLNLNKEALKISIQLQHKVFSIKKEPSPLLCWRSLQRHPGCLLVPSYQAEQRKPDALGPIAESDRREEPLADLGTFAIKSYSSTPRSLRNPLISKKPSSKIWRKKYSKWPGWSRTRNTPSRKSTKQGPFSRKRRGCTWGLKK